jgi:hypothetical protein
MEDVVSSQEPMPAIEVDRAREHVVSVGWTLPMPGGFGNIKPQVTLPYAVRPGETETAAWERVFTLARHLLMRQTLALATGYEMAVRDPKWFAEQFLKNNAAPPQ